MLWKHGQYVLDVKIRNVKMMFTCVYQSRILGFNVNSLNINLTSTAIICMVPCNGLKKRNPGMAVDALAFKQENQKQFAQ